MHLIMQRHQVEHCDHSPVLVGAPSKLEVRVYVIISMRIVHIERLEWLDPVTVCLVLDKGIPELGAHVEPKVQSVRNQFEIESV